MNPNTFRRDRSSSARADAGVAFILVIGVLSGLLVLAAPFLAVALNDREIARKTVDEAEARAYAEGLQRYARATLERTHAWREGLRGDAANDRFATPKYDVAEEFAVSLEILDGQGRAVLGADGTKLLGVDDPRGRMLDLSVRDEQSLPNLWSASPFLIASVLGRGSLAEDLEVDAVELTLDSGDGFPLKNGVLYVEGERIGYETREGATFRGLTRQLPPSTKTRKMRAETWVLDDRARQIACLPWTSPRAENLFREPLDVAAAKEIALVGSGLFTAVEIDKLSRAFNVAAWRYTADGFGLPRVLLSSVDPATADLTDGFRMRVENATSINPGTVVKITDGVNVDYGFVARVQIGGGGPGGGGAAATLSLLEPTKVPYLEGRTSITPLLRHPVNVNTASKDLLIDVFTGIRLTGGRMRDGADGAVKRAGAEFFANGILSARPLKGWEDLRNNLQETAQTYPLVTGPLDVPTIFRNALDANDIQLSNTTVPFCFASYDRYRIEAAASINDQSGRETARRRVRDLVRVAPPETQTFHLRTQQEWERSILSARWSPYFTTYPNPVEIWEPGAEPPFSRAPRMLQFSANSGAAKQAGVFPHTTEGSVRLWPARLADRGGYAEHFDGQAFQQASNIDVADIDPDGFKSENKPFEAPLRNAGTGGGGRSSGRGGRTAGSFLDGRGPNPILVDFWLKTGGVGGRQVWFDLAGSNPDEDRIQIVKEGDGTLRLRVRDRTIPDPSSSLDEVAEWIYTPAPGVWQANTWYHVGGAYRGTKPDDGSVFLDGFKRGRAKYATTLSSSVRRGDQSLTCDDLSDWPQYGAAYVGREIVEFTRIGNSLNAVQYPNNGGTGRGRRGTADIDHGAGTPVRLLGYSSPVESQTRQGGLAVPRGGARLAAALGPFNLASFKKNATENVSLGPPPLPQLQLDVHDPTKSGGGELELEVAPGCPPNYSCFQSSGGYALIVSSFTGVPANIASSLASQGFAAGAELVYYSSATPTKLSGLSAPNLPHFAGPTVTLFGNTTMSVVRQKHPVSFASGPAANRKFVVVFPISIGLTGVQDYFEPTPPPGVSGGVIGNMPEYVSLGQPNYRDINSHSVEWIRYYHRDTARNQLLCDDPVRLNNAIAEAVLVLANQGGANAVLGPWIEVNDALDFRNQKGTHVFGYDSPLTPKSHAANEDVVPVFRSLMHAGIGALPLPTNAAPNTPQPQTPSAPVVGWGDSVTLEQSGASGVRKRYDVSWSAAGDWGTGLVAFGESPGIDFSQPRLPSGASFDRTVVTRLLKFPSGELPRITTRGGRAAVGGDVDGASFSNRIDELRVAAFDEDRFVLWDQAAMGLNSSGTNVVYGSTNTAVDATTDEIPICNADWILSDVNYSPQNPFVTLPDHRRVFHNQPLRGLPNNNAGLVWIDDELIAFREIGVGAGGQPALLKCRRGFMNTVAAPHGYGAEVVFVPFLSVSKLSQACGPRDRDLFLAQARVFAREGGLVLVEDELVHYTEIQGGALRHPPSLDPDGTETGGLLRGRFGTRAAAHDVDDIVVEMPFRYWDRYAERQDNPELGFYGVALDAPGAFIESFAYEELRPNPNVRLRAFLRTEPDVRWSAEPGRGLFAFDEGVAADKPYRIDRVGSICEIRFMARYDGSSFDPIDGTRHEWKSTPELRSLTVRYRDASRVLRRETIK
jgi:hypothetical protein